MYKLKSKIPLEDVGEGRGIRQRSLVQVPKQPARVWALTLHTPGWEGFVPSVEMQGVLVELPLGCTR